ncbi:hypothetical protein NBRC111894_1847 [Sporolactobacillus inulinus]|uniref:Uncharacterized protein n=1 Tax=Sporolactobacillus inulinus TaxID=2078 RepID=A0A4Y1ZBJ5_9BACL|nr:hypothetical protein NBRC111894_1847 [Sporolactobacillus inulinus]
MRSLKKSSILAMQQMKGGRHLYSGDVLLFFLIILIISAHSFEVLQNRKLSLVCPKQKKAPEGTFVYFSMRLI